MKALVISVVLSVSVFAYLPNLDSNYNLARRQLGDCTTPCSWIAGLASCSDTDVSCVCGVVNQAGSAAVSSCASCLQSVNATLAADVESVGEFCADSGSTASAPAPAPTSTPPASVTGIATCTISPCQIIFEAHSSCTDDACFCPTLVAEGPACSACYATVNVTEAQLISLALQDCYSEYPSLATGTGATTTGATSTGATLIPPTSLPCAAQCAGINSAESLCPNASCLCSTLIAQGSACSSCYATINGTQATLIAQSLLSCQSEFASSSNSLSSKTSSTSTTKSVTISLSISSTTSHSGALGGFDYMLGGGMGYVQFVMFLAMVAGLICVFA